MSDWFERLVGFREVSADDVRDKLKLSGTRIHSRVNGASFVGGRLEVVSLNELRDRVKEQQPSGRLIVAEVVGDAKRLHESESTAGALFQVASQFNLLEMVSPSVTPDQGIGIYEDDPTQGPACAIACGAGTIYRNYFVELDGRVGQSAGHQLDCLAEIGKVLGNADGRLWKMKNGYALPSSEGLKHVDASLATMSESQLDELRGELRVGLQWDSQVTLDGCDHFVTQAYCSAMPVAYSGLSTGLWQRFAQLILEGAYEATLAAAVCNSAKTGNNAVYLTLLGGGAFGNAQEWILQSIERACLKYGHYDLDVKIVSYRSSNVAVRRTVESITEQVPNKLLSGSASSKLHNHYCPGCGAEQKSFPRYPWYFCKACLKLAEDGNGRRLEFGNVSFSGGLYWKYAGSEATDASECSTVLCLIHGRPIMVTEARFGGVVAQPLNSSSAPPSGRRVIDLR